MSANAPRYRLVLLNNNVAAMGDWIFSLATEAVAEGEQAIADGRADDYLIDEE